MGSTANAGLIYIMYRDWPFRSAVCLRQCFHDLAAPSAGIPLGECGHLAQTCPPQQMLVSFISCTGIGPFGVPYASGNVSITLLPPVQGFRSESVDTLHMHVQHSNLQQVSTECHGNSRARIAVGSHRAALKE